MTQSNIAAVDKGHPSPISTVNQRCPRFDAQTARQYPPAISAIEYGRESQSNGANYCAIWSSDCMPLIGA